MSESCLCFLGVDVSSMHTMKTQRPSTMMSDVRQLVATGGSLNQPNDDGVTLVSKVTCVLVCVSGPLLVSLPVHGLFSFFNSVFNRYCRFSFSPS